MRALVALSALLLTAPLAAPLAAQLAPAQPSGPRASTTDPRASLKAGYLDAGVAIRNMELVSTTPRSASFTNPANLGDFGFVNADLAFHKTYVFQGGYFGVQIWDVADPKAPKLVTAMACPGGQGDVSVHGNLMFMSVEEPRGRVDCGTQGVRDSVSADRFRGVRIFDISDISKPVRVAAVQTCRGSHTHTLLVSPRDKQNAYVYVSGTSPSRSPSELAGCDPRETSATTSYFRIDVIRVPLANPAKAAIVNSPRVFADAAGNMAGLWKGGKLAADAQETAETDQCHDITVYAELDLAAGACSGNGILLDIKDPANPKRIAEVSDPNFAYWHSATFNNDGSTVLFTDEWGGGVAPRCRATDNLLWGGNAYYRLDLKTKQLTPAGYFKLPAAQSELENCVAHNGSIIPVPGRDLFVQSWYQGGISVTDFTDPDHVREIAHFDRGPLSGERLVLSGQWSTYWHNGRIYGSEIARGLDILELTPSGELTQNEIDAAKLARVETFNPQDQRKVSWPAAFPVAKAYVDQLARWGGLPAARLETVMRQLTEAEAATGAARRTGLTALAKSLEQDARTAADAKRVKALADVVAQLAAAR
jgi:hypothetical protein